MILRPEAARWFELLAARDDVTVVVEALAKTEAVELEVHTAATTRNTIPDLYGRLEEFNRLAERYRQYWPTDGLRPSAVPGRPSRVMDDALRRLYAWGKQADHLIQELEVLRAERTELNLLDEMLAHYGDEALSLALLARAGPALRARLYVLPPRTCIVDVPPSVMRYQITTSLHEFLLLLGPPKEIVGFDQEVAALKGRRVHLPNWLRGSLTENRKQIVDRMARIDQQTQRLQVDINTLAEKYQLRETLADIVRLEWFLTHVANLPVSENFAWVTGWTSDLTGRSLDRALKRAQVRALLRFPQAPPDKQPPMVIQNPPWARPFELFARLLGTPARDEADPSRLLVIIVPLLFGFMFGDLGQGLILFIAGLVLRRRWPFLQLLIAGGISSMLFGILFGSIFGRQDVITPLWLDPLEHPVFILIVPLFGGVGILLLGLLLNALEAYWRGDLASWGRLDAALLTLYVGLVTSFLYLDVGVSVALVGLVWYLMGSLWEGHIGRVSFASAITQLLESMMQLVVNTISFARVGAFALAHAGLSLAIVTLADATGHALPGAIVMLLGNAIVIILEGLVVSVQTTRLVLFEFFVRFLQGEGRVFRPLAAPPSSPRI